VSEPVDAQSPTSFWWHSAVFYQVYPRSFADANGDGIGDLPGLTSRLDYLADLGVEALWLSPFFRSPMADGGYDVADPCDVDPMFGTLADFDAVVQAAHERGIRVTVDIVPNHFSDQHPWFQQARAAGPGSPERARFIFRDGRGEHGDLPPNNWPSAFGGPAWQRLADGDQWYLHLFAPEQPDLNWENPEIPAEFARIMRFWLDRGADGFRVDVANSMAKAPGLPDMAPSVLAGVDQARMPSADDPRWDQDAVHEYLRGFRQVLDAYDGDRMAVGEAYVEDPERLARYVRPGELNLTFNFLLIKAEWDAEEFRSAIDRSLHAMAEVGAPCTWALANHDNPRHVTRYGGGPEGLARARAAALIQLALPGAVYVYNGDELGLPNAELPDAALQDPTWERSGHTRRGRDGERVPLPWSGSRPPFGFSAADHTWLPMPESWAPLTVEAQQADTASTLALYTRALALRRTNPDLRGGEFDWVEAPEGSLAFRRGPDLVVAVNFADTPAPLPPGEVILASNPVGEDGLVPAHTGVWLRNTIQL
jgi:alpha-glucosidase